MQPNLLSAMLDASVTHTRAMRAGTVRRHAVVLLWVWSNDAQYYAKDKRSRGAVASARLAGLVDPTDLAYVGQLRRLGFGVALL